MEKSTKPTSAKLTANNKGKPKKEKCDNCGIKGTAGFIKGKGWRYCSKCFGIISKELTRLERIDEEDICGELHEEYHRAEIKVLKRLKIKELSQPQRIEAIIAYLSCVATSDFIERTMVEKQKFEMKK